MLFRSAKLTKYEEEATEEGDAIDADLKTYYENKKAEAIKKISGTEIPCISSDDLISSGKAVIGTGKSGDFVISFTIVLNKDLKPIAPFISYKYFNAEGEVLSASTQYFEPGEYKIGDTLEFDEPISNKKFLCKIKEINFMN